MIRDMKWNKVPGLALVLVGLASTASLLAGLRHALRREKRVEPQLTALEAERRRIREALGDMLAPPIDFSEWPEHLRPSAGVPTDWRAYMRSLPELHPPLSQTVMEDRGDRT